MKHDIHWYEEDVGFSINKYDDHGKITEVGIFIHIGKDIICATHELDLDSYREFIETLDYMGSEIEEFLN
jgi:hypothetical protein